MKQLLLKGIIRGNMANAGTTVSHKRATCITSFSWIWTAGTLPASDAHESSVQTHSIQGCSCWHCLAVLLELNVCPIVNRYDFAVMSRWSRRSKWNKIKIIWPNTNSLFFEAQWAAIGQGLSKLEKYSLVPGLHVTSFLGLTMPKWAEIWSKRT